MAVDTNTYTDGGTVEFEGNDQENDAILNLPQSQRTIVTKSTDPEVESLYGKYKRGKLILDPDFQRRFVWDKVKASRLIESALLNVPLPIIYLAEEPNGKESVIDGQQRLTSFFSFIDGKLPNGEVFRLTKLNVFSELEKKTYKDLDEELQDRIRYHQIRAITILHSSDPALRFEIFERLNRGAVPLNDMELRNCVYAGNYMNVLKDMAQEPDFMELMGFKTQNQRMQDVELVLRFAAFYHSTYLKYKGPMKSFLNQDMQNYRYITKEDADKLKAAFKNGLQIVKSLFGPHAFKRFIPGNKTKPQGGWTTSSVRNTALYDVLMGVFCLQDKNRVYAALDPLREGIIGLMVSDTDFMDSLQLFTSQESRVKLRFTTMQNCVDTTLQNYKSQPRLFSSKLKKELFEKDSSCAICHQQISDIDDAALDHIQQYGKGGQTVPENARLTHRYCNLARSRND